MKYLLDTTLLIDHTLDVAGARRVVERLFEAPNDLLTCDVVVAEAMSGGTDGHRELLRTLIAALEYVAIPPEAAAWAGESRRLRRASSHRTLGDALIAGVAWFTGATIVTRNPADFAAHGIPVLTYG